jgi:hypothetical protein
VTRNNLRLLGLLLLVPALFFALLPYLAAHTMMVNGLSEFSLHIGDLTVVDFHKDLNGDPAAQSHWVNWIVAVVGEILLLSAWVVRPIDRNRHKITIHG